MWKLAADVENCYKKFKGKFSIGKLVFKKSLRKLISAAFILKCYRPENWKKIKCIKYQNLVLK